MKRDPRWMLSALVLGFSLGLSIIGVARPDPTPRYTSICTVTNASTGQVTYVLC